MQRHRLERSVETQRFGSKRLERSGLIKMAQNCGRLCLLWGGLGALLYGCGEDEADKSNIDPLGEDEIVVPRSYSFVADDGASTVAYNGQTFRQVLMHDLSHSIEGLTEEIDAGTFVPTTGDVQARLNYYFKFDGDIAGDEAPALASSVPLLQTRYSDISSGANLVGKLAGNDAVGQHRDWDVEFVGWEAEGGASPESLLEHWFALLDEAAVARANDAIAQDPFGRDLAYVHTTGNGWDLQQLVDIFLQGAVAFSQGTDDYLDDDVEGKGLRTENTRSEGKAYTQLAHQWDEAFGYFGAAQDGRDYSLDEAAGQGGRDGWSLGYHDSDGDDRIDARSEIFFGHAQDAAKRDSSVALGANPGFKERAFEAFVRGRALIAASGELPLGAEDFATLQVYRDEVVAAWEETIAASVIHTINAVLKDVAPLAAYTRLETTLEEALLQYDFAQHAKDWSAMKAYGLSLQFNPRSKLKADDFAQMHAWMGMGPEWGQSAGDGALAQAQNDALAARADDLRRVRTLLGERYGFAAANLGDADGAGGF